MKSSAGRVRASAPPCGSNRQNSTEASSSDRKQCDDARCIHEEAIGAATKWDESGRTYGIVGPRDWHNPKIKWDQDQEPDVSEAPGAR